MKRAHLWIGRSWSFSPNIFEVMPSCTFNCTPPTGKEKVDKFDNRQAKQWALDQAYNFLFIHRWLL